jgi:hypothetical protein
VGEKMTSMAKILGKAISRKEVAERIIFHFREVFKKEWEERDLEGLMAVSRLESSIPFQAAHKFQ